MLAKFRGKPELSVDQFTGFSVHEGDAIMGGDIEGEIASHRDSLSESKVSKLYRQTLIYTKDRIRKTIEVENKQEYRFVLAGRRDALIEMNHSGDFYCVELDADA